MCGIIGYVGQRACKDLLLQGLERLEYRGYDSAGLALREEDGLDYVRAVGNLQALKRRPARTARRRRRASATRAGRRTAPSTSRTRTRSPAATSGKLAIVLNGIVENYRELKASLEAEGHVFHTETDAEVVVASDRAPLRRRPARGDAPGLPRARGPLRLRRHPPRPPGGARRRAPPVPAARRRRRRRDVPRLDGRGVHRRDALDPADRGRRGRLDHARGLALRLRRGWRARARGDRGRLGHRGRREERLRDVHAEGDLRAARGRRARRSATASATASSCSRASA